MTDFQYYYSLNIKRSRCVLSLNNINYLLLEKLLIAAIAIENWKYASSLCFFTVVTLTLLIMQITLLNSDGEGFFQHIYNWNWNFLSLKCLPLTRHLKFGKRKHTGKVTYWVSLHVILTCISARQKKTMLYFQNFRRSENSIFVACKIMITPTESSFQHCIEMWHCTTLQLHKF